jgi:Asp-tRNA(Asn)/Glu-tRNA(Gln) amidotransferase A subunit family amidase
MNPSDLTAVEAARHIAASEFSAEAMVRGCLDRIAEREPTVRAWAHLDPEHALAQALALDAQRRGGQPLGPLHGVPVGIKDIFDTADFPTEYGSPLAAGRRPGRDAAVVAQLRQAGAVILGKTVTTEFAAFHPGQTRNPHDPARTPGGSSSGSAAAVAAGMLALSVGSQTDGSTVRPAAFCGVVGFKPSHGWISRRGMLRQSRALDHVGLFARTVEDVALLVDCLSAYDEADPDMRQRSRGRLAAAAAAAPSLPPTFALVRTAHWEQTDATTQAAFAELTDFLGARIDELKLPEDFARAPDCHETIVLADLAMHLRGYYDRGAERLSPQLRAMIEAGRTVKAVDYASALDRREAMAAGLAEVFERYDAILTPAAPGVAPKGLESTGNPIFATTWSFLGTPAVSLPIFADESGLPIGVQMVANRGDDARLLRTANWLMHALDENS